MHSNLIFPAEKMVKNVLKNETKYAEKVMGKMMEKND